jgi:hypothetical protein
VSHLLLIIDGYRVTVLYKPNYHALVIINNLNNQSLLMRKSAFSKNGMLSYLKYSLKSTKYEPAGVVIAITIQKQ